jgi:hypothetical protein
MGGTYVGRLPARSARPQDERASASVDALSRQSDSSRSLHQELGPRAASATPTALASVVTARSRAVTVATVRTAAAPMALSRSKAAAAAAAAMAACTAAVATAVATAAAARAVPSLMATGCASHSAAISTCAPTTTASAAAKTASAACEDASEVVPDAARERPSWMPASLESHRLLRPINVAQCIGLHGGHGQHNAQGVTLAGARSRCALAAHYQRLPRTRAADARRK